MEQEKVARSKEKVHCIVAVTITILCILTAIIGMTIAEKNRRKIKIENVDEFCTLVQERYQISISKDEVSVRKQLPNLSDRSGEKLYYYTVEYLMLDNDSIYYGAKYTKDMESMKEAEFNLEQQLLLHYKNKYLKEYIDKDFQSAYGTYDMMFGKSDSSDIKFTIDVKEGQIDTVIRAIEDFNAVYWSEEPVVVRDTTYSLIIHFYDDRMVSRLDPDSIPEDIKITLSASNHEIDYKELRDSCYKAWENHK